jgi:hypothetical protein
MPARRGPAIIRRGRSGAALRFRLSRAAMVRFEVVREIGAPEELEPKLDHGERGFAPSASGQRADGTGAVARGARPGATAGARRAVAPAASGRFSVRGRRGLNRLRFSGRVRGRPLAAGAYVLRAVAVDRAGRTSPPRALPFRIGRPEH